MRKAALVIGLIFALAALTTVANPQRRSKSMPPPSTHSVPSRATPTPSPAPSVKEIGESLWRVTLPADGNWFDTGIPVICNMEVDIRNLSRDRADKFLTKVAGKVFYNQNAGFDNMRTMFLLYIAEDQKHGPANIMVEHDFQDTIKLKIDDEGSNNSLFLTVRLEERHDFDQMRFNTTHMTLHEASRHWFKAMKSTLSRQ
jgi:hypothetical protein